VIPDIPKPDWALLADLTMVALLRGRERTRNEYQKPLASAGFRLERAMDVGQSTAILEAVPVRLSPCRNGFWSSQRVTITERLLRIARRRRNSLSVFLHTKKSVKVDEEDFAG